MPDPLVEATWEASPEVPIAFAQGRLPAPLTSFVGREREVAALRRLLRRDATRLVVLTGPGGIGKTRLALQAAADRGSAFPDGAAFVPLAAIRSPHLLVPTIAATLPLPDDDRPALARLLDYLAPRRLLLVLDNFEQIAAAAPLLTDLLARCPGLKILVTCRLHLHVSGAHDVPVAPLPAPPAGAAFDAVSAAAFAAVELFVERARAVAPGFDLTEANAPVVAAICRHLEGIPLAIELAAAQTRVHSPQSLLARLSHRIPVLGDGPLDQPDRLRSMRDAIAWSDDLLDDAAKCLFRRLAVYVGGFSLDAATWTAAGDADGGGPERPVRTDAELPPPALRALLDASLVRRVADVAGEPRFAMLETIREYGLDRLAAAGERAERAARDDHAAWCIAFAERAEPELRGPAQDAWVLRIDAELPNVRAAHAWLDERDDAVGALRLAGALGWFWCSADHFREGIDLFRSVVAMPGGAAAPAALAKALFSLGDLAHWLEDLDTAVASYERALQLCRQTGDDRRAVGLLRALGSVAIDRGDLDRAEEHLAESRLLAQSTGEAWEAAAAANLLGAVALGRGDLRLARERHAEAAAGWDRVGDPGHVTVALASRAWVELAERDCEAAARTLGEVLERSLQAPDEVYGMVAVAGTGGVAAMRGNWRRSAWLFAAAAAHLERLGVDPLRPATRAIVEQWTAATEEALPAAAFATEAAAGRRATFAEAAAVAGAVLAPGGTSPAPESDRLGLTRRELDVLRLLAQGATDREIAAALFIERPTASKHVAAVLAKLGVQTRAAAAAVAGRLGLSG